MGCDPSIDHSTGKPLSPDHPGQVGIEQKLSSRGRHHVPALGLTKNMEVALTRTGN